MNVRKDNRGERKARITGAAIIIAIAALAFAYHTYGPLLRPAAVTAAGGSSERTDGYFTVQDENSRTIFTTGHNVTTGDEFIDENDIRYVIERVSGDVATARTVGKMAALPDLPTIVRSGPPAKTAGPIGIYHTHSDESYIPSDGSDSVEGRGGVLKVGAAMANKLDSEGFQAIHDETLHGPHDAAAYDRSRRTAAQLLKNKPLALFDVHRDAGPAEPYLKQVGGDEVTRCMIVVGRTNPKMSANLEFARRLRDSVNSENQGLIKGIFLGNSDFNQDLYDRALLLELGTEKTPREAAERGIRLVAAGVPKLLGVTSPGGGGTSKGTGKAIGWVLGLAVAGTFIYLWIATGSWEEMKAKILGWFGAGGVKIGERRQRDGGDGGQGSGNAGWK